jgi:hypothetical protein
MSRDHHPPLREVTDDKGVFRAWPRDDVLLFLHVGTCLQSCDLAMGIHVTLLLYQFPFLCFLPFSFTRALFIIDL